MKQIKNIFSKFSDPLNHIDWFAVFATVIPFALYMATLAPSVTFFDSGEFVTATASLGSAHSPGYPLYLMYAKIFTWLPFGNIAFRVNMATAFSSSLACLGVYLLASHILHKEAFVSDARFTSFAIKITSLSAALTFSVSPRLWLQSNHDKPYPLLAFMTSIIFYLLLKWRDHYTDGDEQPSYVYACAFLTGLAMALHQTVVLLLPAWGVFIIFTDWRMIKRIKELCVAISAVLLGFAVHLYLPLRATQNPILNWGDPQNSSQFLWHFLRKGYPEEPHSRNLALLWEQLGAFSLPHEFGWPGLILVLFALFKLWSGQKHIVITYLVAIMTFLLVIAGYFNTVQELIFLTEEFFTPLYLLSAVMIGVGLFHLILFVITIARVPLKHDKQLYVILIILVLVFPTTLCAVNYYENDQHNNYIAFDYGTNSLRSLPENAVMFTWGDSGAFPLWYLQWVERMREDVDLPHTPHLVFEWYLDSLPRIFKDSKLRGMNLKTMPADLMLGTAVTSLIAQRPVFLDFSTRYSVSFNDYMPIQNGIVYRLRSSKEPGGLANLGIWENYNNRGIVDKISFLDLDTGKAIMIYANSYLEMGEFLLSIGNSMEGLIMLEKSEKISPEMKSAVMALRNRYGFVSESGR